MAIDQKILEACVKGVLVERGLLAEEADCEVAKLRRPQPQHLDVGLVRTVREVSSIILTLHAHGLIKDTTN